MNDLSTLEEFFDEISRVLIPDTRWGHNLDAFNDILRGGFGTPEEGFFLTWENSKVSKNRLGYSETMSQLERRLERCHPTHRNAVSAQLKHAQNKIGTTVFDWLVSTIKDHGVGGEEPLVHRCSNRHKTSAIIIGKSLRINPPRDSM